MWLRFGCGLVSVKLRFGCGRPIKTANDRRNEIAVSLRCSPFVFDRIRNMVTSLSETGNRYISKIVIRNKLYH